MARPSYWREDFTATGAQLMARCEASAVRRAGSVMARPLYRGMAGAQKSGGVGQTSRTKKKKKKSTESLSS